MDIDIPREFYEIYHTQNFIKDILKSDVNETPFKIENSSKNSHVSEFKNTVKKIREGLKNNQHISPHVFTKESLTVFNKIKADKQSECIDISSKNFMDKLKISFQFGYCSMKNKVAGNDFNWSDLYLSPYHYNYSSNYDYDTLFIFSDSGIDYMESENFVLFYSEYYMSFDGKYRNAASKNENYHKGYFGFILGKTEEVKEFLMKKDAKSNSFQVSDESLLGFFLDSRDSSLAKPFPFFNKQKEYVKPIFTQLMFSPRLLSMKINEIKKYDSNHIAINRYIVSYGDKKYYDHLVTGRNILYYYKKYFEISEEFELKLKEVKENIDHEYKQIEKSMNEIIQNVKHHDHFTNTTPIENLLYFFGKNIKIERERSMRLYYTEIFNKMCELKNRVRPNENQEYREILDKYIKNLKIVVLNNTNAIDMDDLETYNEYIIKNVTNYIPN